MGHALFWSHALYKPKWQVAKSLLSYYIPTYIVMMAQLIIKKQFTIVFELLKRRRSKFLGVSHLSLYSPIYTFLAKKLFPVYLKYFSVAGLMPVFPSCQWSVSFRISWKLPVASPYQLTFLPDCPQTHCRDLQNYRSQNIFAQVLPMYYPSIAQVLPKYSPFIPQVFPKYSPKYSVNMP